MLPRDLALYELDRRRLPGWPAAPLLRPRPERLDDPRDAALAERILFGTIQNLLLLQNLIHHYSGRNAKSIDPLVQKILSLALYQLRFLERIPPSAAVNEAVNQVKRFGRSKSAGFVNAVLRKATRELPPPLPDRQAEPAQYAALALSHPPELFERLRELVGAEEALALCEHDNREPPLIVRLAPGATERELQLAGLMIRPHEREGCFVIEGAKRSHLADLARRGIAQAQDPTAVAVVADGCPIEPGWVALDRCAGLGTKTLQLLERVGQGGRGGRVVAVDPNPIRSRTLQSLLAERGIANAAVYEASFLSNVPELKEVSFDLALVDAPCSNSGVLARRPEARYAQSKSALRSLAHLQSTILADTASHVRPGGFLVYSTCSIWPEENRGQIERFLDKRADYTLVTEKATLPSLSTDPTRYHDGGYWARLQRSPNEPVTS